jgi:hypothetical protein
MPTLPNPYVLIGAAAFWFASCVGVYFWAQGIEAEPTTVSEPGFRGPDPAITLRNAGLELQRWVKLCHQRLRETGR